MLIQREDIDVTFDAREMRHSIEDVINQIGDSKVLSKEIKEEINFKLIVIKQQVKEIEQITAIFDKIRKHILAPVTPVIKKTAKDTLHKL